jgi:hypothetical protein
LSSTVKQKGSQVNPQKTARVAGVLFVITFISAILAALILYGPVLDDPRYIVGAGAGTRVIWGALLEVILVIANIGTAVVLSRWSNLRNKSPRRAAPPTCDFARILPLAWDMSFRAVPTVHGHFSLACGFFVGSESFGGNPASVNGRCQSVWPL